MRFAECLPFILAREGGYVDDPLDHGGATKWGITQRAYSRWLINNGLPVQPVKFMTVDECSSIYRADYWDAGHCDNLPQPLDLAAFDSWVQHRPVVAAKFLQQAVGVNADGIIGRQTLNAAKTVDPHAAALRVVELREAFYKRLVEQDQTQARFLNGWMNRMRELRHVLG